MPQGPQVQVIASPGGSRVVNAANGNSALALASSLSGVNEALQPVLQGIAEDGQKKAQAKATADALKNSGQAFAEAVRDGKLEKTQNPWYISAYEKASAGVRARAGTTDLLNESQTWAERTDPAAYQAKFTKRLGEMQEALGATSPDAAEGFTAAASPLFQQAVQQNIQYNVHRINEEHEQNISALATGGILAAAAQHGGKLSTDQLTTSWAAQHDSFIGTGGTEADWKLTAFHATLSAAYQTGNAGLLDALPADILNIAGPDGQPLAATVATAQYRIEQAAEAQGTRAIRAKQNAVTLEGLTAVPSVWEHFGAGLLDGNTSAADVRAFLTSQGVSPQGSAAAVSSIYKAVADNVALSNALQKNDVGTIELYSEGLTQGYSPAYEAKVAEEVRTGRMTPADAKSFLSSAQARTNHLESEARSDSRAAKSDARAAASSERLLRADQAKTLKTYRDQVEGEIATRTLGAGIRTLNQPKQRTILKNLLEDTEGSWLLNHPGDAAGAQVAVQGAAASYVRNQIASHKPATGGKPSAAPRGGGNNPRD